MDDTLKLIMKLDVPYYSQFLDVDEKEWMPRACAMAALAMVLAYYKDENGNVMDLVREGLAKGPYNPAVGWYHDTIVAVAKDHGLSAERAEKMADDSRLIEYLRSGKPIIVSAIKYILDQTKFHMVVLTGFEEKDGVVLGFYYHDPESTERERGQHLFVRRDTFLREWRKMAIFCTQ